MALVTVGRHTVYISNFLLKFINCFTQDEVGICSRFDFPGLEFLCTPVSLYVSGP